MNIPAGRVDPAAAVAANERLWVEHPELKGRQLTGGVRDQAYRHEWMKFYQAEVAKRAGPPTPAVQPQSVPLPLPVISTAPVQACSSSLETMTHEQKMEEAIKRANLPAEVMEELGDIKTLIASAVVLGGALTAIAATGYGAVAEGVGAFLLVVGAAVSGWQIGSGINSFVDFFSKTRCDTARTSADLDAAGKSFGDAVAKIGVGSLTLALGLRGGAKGMSKDAAEEIGVLRDATRGKGNFGVGSASRKTSARLGEAWVGEGSTVASDGKTLISADGLRQYRPPSLKPKLGKTQANFEQRQSAGGPWQSNGHLDITD